MSWLIKIVAQSGQGSGNFEDLQISDLSMRAIKEDFGFTTMTPIQAAAIPILLKGKYVDFFEFV